MLILSWLEKFIDGGYDERQIDGKRCTVRCYVARGPRFLSERC